MHADPSGAAITTAAWEAGRAAWLPSEADAAFVQHLMGSAVLDPKQMAHWISAPKQGIKGRPIDFEYVRRA
jgi:benzoyl-CoA 2,3-dioxygenase component B